MEDVIVQYNPAFEPFFDSPKFYKILYGSAGSGKSYAIAQKIIKRLLDETPHHAWCFRKVSTYILESVYATLLQVISDYGVRSQVHVNRTNKTLHFSNGNTISCAGLDDEEKIKSILNMTIAWVEEATEFEEQDINQIDLRMRGESPVLREMILSFNPISELHWIKQKFFDDVPHSVEKRLFTLHTTFKDNLFLDEEYVDRLSTVHAHDENNYRVYVKGEWGRIKTNQEYYKWFDLNSHVKSTDYNPNLPLHITWDFNVLPYLSLSLWQIEKMKEEKEYWLVRGIEEILGKHPMNTTEGVCNYFYDHWADRVPQGILVYGDATGRARKTSSSKTDYAIIQQILGHLIVEVRVPRSNPTPIETHTFMNRMMYGSLPVRFIVHPNMKFTIQDFTHVLEDGERRKVKQAARDPVSKQIIEKYGHLSDAADYLVMEAFKQFRI